MLFCFETWHQSVASIIQRSPGRVQSHGSSYLTHSSAGVMSHYAQLTLFLKITTSQLLIPPCCLFIFNLGLQTVSIFSVYFSAVHTLSVSSPSQLRSERTLFFSLQYEPYICQHLSKELLFFTNNFCGQ